MSELRGEAWLQSKRKRAFDVVVSLSLSPVALPTVLGAGTLIRIIDGVGPHFRQTRYSQSWDKFTIHKLRTMPYETNDTLGTGPLDARASPLGRLLRVSHIDEFPQLLNVLRGDMSLVGPRPLTEGAVYEILDNLDPGERVEWQRARRLAKCGLVDSYGATLYANEANNYETVPRERAIADIEYVQETASLRTDFELLVTGARIMCQGALERSIPA